MAMPFILPRTQLYGFDIFRDIDVMVENNANGTKKIRVKELILHTNYFEKNQGRLRYNLALLRLKEDIMYDGMLTIFMANWAVPFKQSHAQSD